MNTSYLLAAATAVLMSIGQILFKLGADQLKTITPSGLFISILSNHYLTAAVFLYATTILLWVYVLKTLPLSAAYPITALAFIIVPILSGVILGEKLTLQAIAGSLLIISGIAVIHFQRA